MKHAPRILETVGVLFFIFIPIQTVKVPLFFYSHFGFQLFDCVPLSLKINFGELQANGSRISISTTPNRLVKSLHQLQLEAGLCLCVCEHISQIEQSNSVEYTIPFRQNSTHKHTQSKYTHTTQRYDERVSLSWLRIHTKNVPYD